MSEMKDLIIGAYDHLGWNHLKYIVNSIKKTGYTGDICFVCFNSTFETVDRLVEEGVMVVACEKDEANKVYKRTGAIPVHVERFFHFFNILKDNAYKYRYVIHADLRDIIFQKNPSDWLDETLRKYGKQVVVTSECMKYSDEPRETKNLEQTFGPYFHDYFKHNPIYNVGFFAGESIYIRDLCLNIFLMATNRPIPICDQSVFNVLMYNTIYRDCVYYADMKEGLICHLGTVMDPTKIDSFRPYLLEKEPIFENDLFKTHTAEVFVAAHQWDRTAHKEEVEKIYG